MGYKVWKKVAAGTLAAVMAVGVTACGGEGGASADAKQRYFKAEYLTDLPDSFSDNVVTVKFNGDQMFYSAYNEDYTKCTVYSYNMVSGDSTELYALDQRDGSGGNAYISDFTVSEDGELYLCLNRSEVDPSSVTEDYSGTTLEDVLDYMVENWGYDEEMAASDWEDYYAGQYVKEDGSTDYEAFMIAQNAQYIQTSSVVKIDQDGNIVFNQDLEKDDPGQSMNSNGMAVDQKGNLYMALSSWSENSNDEYYILICDAEGREKGKIKTDDYISTMLTLKDGMVYTMGWADSGCVMTPVDADAMKMLTDKTIEVPSNSVTVFDEKNLLLSDGTNLYKYNMDTKEKELYMNWMDCNISSSAVNDYSVLSDGRMAVYTQNWNSNGNQVEVALIKEVDASEVAQTINLTMGMLWSDSMMQDKIIAFNKSQDTYHINVKTYYEDGLEYEDAVNNFTTAITSGDGVDLVLFNDYSQALNFASKGMNADLYSLIDGDADLSRDDFLPNVLGACEYDGKLAFMPLTISVQTIVGKTEEVGTTPGWTLQQMKDLLASKPEGTKLLDGMERGGALNMMLNLGYQDFVNLEDTTCNFDSQEFIDVLEFAAMFPEIYEWSDDSEGTFEQIRSGKVLLDNYYLDDLNYIQVYRAMFGGDVTFIGYPTSGEGNGAMMGMNDIVGISNSCKDMGGAWQFFRTLFLPEKEGEDSYTSWGFSVRKDKFEKICQKAMSDEDSGMIYGFGEGMDVEIKPATQADIDQVKDLVYNTTAVQGAVSDGFINIINEESAAFFSGQKSAEEVAKIIQSRMQVYLSETK